MWSSARTRLLLLVFGVGLAGGASGALTGCGAPCKDRVAAFRAMFAGLTSVVEDEPGLHLPARTSESEQAPADMMLPPAPLDLPRSAGGIRVEHGLALVVHADGTMFTSVSPPLAAPELAAELIGMKGAPTRERPLLVAMESGAPLPSLAAFVSSLVEHRPADAPAEAMHLQILTYPEGHRAASEADFPPGVKAWLAERRAQLKEDRRDFAADPLGSVVAGATGRFAPDITCSALRDVYEPSSVHPDGFLELVKAAPRVIEEDCGCRGVDVEALAAWMWVRYEAWNPVMRGHDWSLGPADAEVVEFASDAIVRELLAVIDARAGRPFRVLVTGAAPAR